MKSWTGSLVGSGWNRLEPIGTDWNEFREGVMSRSSGVRRCSRTSCNERAVAILSYNYGDQVAHLSPIQGFVEPHTYDLCLRHSQSLKVPVGWKIIINEISDQPVASHEDFNEIANAVRGVLDDEGESEKSEANVQPELRRRGHLRAL